MLFHIIKTSNCIFLKKSNILFKVLFNFRDKPFKSRCMSKFALFKLNLVKLSMNNLRYILEPFKMSIFIYIVYNKCKFKFYLFNIA